MKRRQFIKKIKTGFAKTKGLKLRSFLIFCTCLNVIWASNGNFIHEITNTYIQAGIESSSWQNLSGGKITGQMIEYYSPFPEVTKAAICRASSGNSSIEIISDISTEKDTVSLVMLVGIGVNQGEYSFTMHIDSENIFDFETYDKHYWEVTNKNGSRIEFKELMTDIHGDKFGLLNLKIPTKYIIENKIQINITGKKQNSNAWVMVFQDEKLLKRLQEISQNSYQYQIEINNSKNIQVNSVLGCNNFSTLLSKNSTFPISIYCDTIQIDEVVDIDFDQQQYSIFNDQIIYRTISKKDDKKIITCSQCFFITIPDEEYPWTDFPQEFPCLTKYKNNIVMAVAERQDSIKQISIYNDENKINLSSKEWTGIGSPDISSRDGDILVAFSYEMDNHWNIGYKYLSENKKHTIQTKSRQNSHPKIMQTKLHDLIVFQGLIDDFFQIFVFNIKTKKLVQLSEGNYNNYNPDITSTENGKIYVVWDSFRLDNFNIYSKQFIKNKWRNEKQLTFSKRIERHPSITTNKDEIWLAWQAQSYGNIESKFHEKNIRLNHVDEQRIVVAKWENNKLSTLPDMFSKVSPENKYLLRPELAFSKTGSLILTYRQSAGNTEGWLPVLQQFANNNWTKPQKISDMTGNWNSIPIIVNNNTAFLGVQFDTYPNKTRKYSKKYKYHSKVEIIEAESNKNIEEIKTNPLSMPETNFYLKKKRDLVSAEFPRQTIDGLNLYFGNLHEHTTLSKCARAFNPPVNDLYTNLRDIEELDFCAITDHEAVSQAHWYYNAEMTRRNQIDHQFITFLGEEWTSTMHRNNDDYGLGYGHRNLIFLNPYQPVNYKPNNGKMTPDELWNLLKDEEFITIPHQLADWEHMKIAKGVWGNPPIDWHYHDKKYQPVAEIYQDRGSYEHLGCPKQAHDSAPFKQYYLQDAWARKLIIGTIASSDHGGGHGKIGVWAEELSREAIFKAIQKRHTFGSSAPKMSIFFSSGKNIMGSIISNTKDYNFQIEGNALQNVDEISIFRNNQIVKKIDINATEFSVNWKDDDPLLTDFIWYYVRLKTEDNEFAWTSPIWFVK